MAGPPGMIGTRRNFFVGVMYGLWGLMTAALSIPSLLYLMARPRMRRQGEWVTIGDVSRLPTNVPVEMAFRRNRVDGWKVVSETNTAWVLKVSDSNLVAYAPQCTHLGCAYHWDPRRSGFICPCHNSIFSIDGKVLEGPAPRGLDRYQVRIDGRNLLLGPLQSLDGTNQTKVS